MRAGRVVCAVVLIAGLARGEKALTSATLREYVLEHYQQSPPDYTCSRATHLESHNPIPPPLGGLSGWYTDTAEEELTVHGLREQHQTVNIDPDATAVGHLRNPITSGEFGVILKNLVGLKSKSKVRWVRFDNLRGRRVSVFTFDVPRSEGARFYDSDNRPVVVAYHGFLYADGETHAVARVETRLPEFPAESNVKSVLVTLDYQVTKLGNHEFSFPRDSRFTGPGILKTLCPKRRRVCSQDSRRSQTSLSPSIGTIAL